LAPSSSQTEGPFSLREIDVKFRTNECTSMWHVWREGMAEWKRAFEVPEVKQVIMESRGEVLDEVVQEYLAKNMAKAAKGK
jgi:phage baseplate assembly protein gpV